MADGNSGVQAGGVVRGLLDGWDDVVFGLVELREREEGFELGKSPGGVVLREDGERVEAAVELVREPHFAAGVGKIVFYGDGLCGGSCLLKEKADVGAKLGGVGLLLIG